MINKPEDKLMKNILVTGANGFVGKNLVATLEQLNGINVLTYDLHNTNEELAGFIECADFIFHLAGVNRSKDISDFDAGNRGFTKKLLEMMDATGRRVPILISSSIQADLDNPYGKSKRAAEQLVINWAKKNQIPAYVYRLPNLFGKWCRPNYNSVVATFCYNIARGLPIKINDPAVELTLAYIDDVVLEFINAMNQKPTLTEGDYCKIPYTFKITLQELADKLYSFAESKISLVMPDFKDEFEKYLYATYLSYLPENEFGYELEMKHDNRGWLAEFIKSEHFGQVFISRTKPGITRGNHWHHTKVEKFLVIEGEAVVKFRRIGGEDIIEYPVSGEKLKVVDIPVGYTHSITNIGNTDVITLFWADEIFDSTEPDTYYLEV